MLREINHIRAEALVDYLRTLPKVEQEIIISRLSGEGPKKKLGRKEKNTLRELRGIAEGLREIKEAKRAGKELMDLDDLLSELNNESNEDTQQVINDTRKGKTHKAKSSVYLVDSNKKQKKSQEVLNDDKLPITYATGKADVTALAGIWKDKDIKLEEIRKNAWGNRL